MFPTPRCSRLAPASAVAAVPIPTAAEPVATARAALAGAALAGVLLAGGAAAQSEPPTVTIADLTAAQRALIDAEIRRTLGKAQGRPEALVPALPTAAAAAQPIPMVPAVGGETTGAPGSATPLVAPPSLIPNAPQGERLSVTGQARLHGSWRAEVVTDTGVYLLATGQAVPGTGWRVASVEPGRVTLSETPPAGPRGAKEPRRVRTKQRHFVLGDTP